MLIYEGDKKLILKRNIFFWKLDFWKNPERKFTFVGLFKLFILCLIYFMKSFI